MCIFGRKSLCFLSLFLVFSFSAFSQVSGSPLSVQPPSASSVPDSLDALLIAPSEPSSPQTTPQMSLEKRQALMLQAWIEWYKAEMTWREKVLASWKKAKDSYEKLDASRVLQINSRDFEIEALKSELKKARFGEILYGAGGFAAGYAAGRLTK